jgi:hypothetical protein
MNKEEGILSFNRSMEDKAYDLLGDMLTARKTASLLQAIEAEEAQGNTAETDAFLERQDRKNLKLIDAYARRQRIRRLFTKTLPRVGQIAAVIIALIALGGGIAIAASDTLRVQVMRLLLEPTEEYVRLSLVEDESASFDVPADWLGKNYPAYLPKNVLLHRAIPLEEMPTVEYVDSRTQNIVFRFHEFSADTVGNIDIEGAVIKQIEVNGYQAQLTKKGDIISLYWSDGQVYFLVTTIGMTEEETLLIGRSVRRIS